MIVERPVPMRSSRSDPLTGGGALALRRICGVCRFHTGANIRSDGACTRFQLSDVSGLRSAADCDDWERPTVAPVAKAGSDAPAPKPKTSATKVKRAAAPRQCPAKTRRAVVKAKAETAKAARHAEIRWLAKQGLKQAEAAKRIGISRSQLGRDLTAMGVKWSALKTAGQADV